ncbi:MAG: division/cell wall cluster transcriptional repressor MraZ [Saprospiraceae bacterium]
MIQLQGEYDCKVDAKGRFRLPTQLVRQLGEVKEQSLHVNRGMEKCLTLYPNEVWQKVTAQVNNLNLYNSQNRKFARYFYRGATELTIDKSDRLLIPRNLAKYAEIENEVVLFAFHNRIEIWSKPNYEAMLEEQDDDEFANLADSVMGKASND